MKILGFKIPVHPVKLGLARMYSLEIGLHRVENGKIVSEQFFY
jgi:hypothetical protein